MSPYNPMSFSLQLHWTPHNVQIFFPTANQCKITSIHVRNVIKYQTKLNCTCINPTLPGKRRLVLISKTLYSYFSFGDLRKLSWPMNLVLTGQNIWWDLRQLQKRWSQRKMQCSRSTGEDLYIAPTLTIYRERRQKKKGHSSSPPSPQIIKTGLFI